MPQAATSRTSSPELSAALRLAEFAADVRDGLRKQDQKELPSKYFYDDVGSALFEAITLLPEYGLTRAEQRILAAHADEVAERLGAPVIVAELGSGSGKKTRLILEALARRQPTTYHPIEISRTALEMCERELDHMESVSIVGYESEYLEGLRAVASRRTRAGGPLLVLFLGSSIGNFDRKPGDEFLAEVRRALVPGDALLLGTDFEKPVSCMALAYDDPAGVTAAFNLNLLARINRELGADFDLRRFRHEARYDSARHRIEMHLRSTARQTVTIPQAGFAVTFRQGETIWTESAHKYDHESVAEMTARSGFRCEAQWVDAEWPFADTLLAPV